MDSRNKTNGPKKLEIGFFLITKGDLNQYQFADLTHARVWLQQKFVDDKSYSVLVTRFKRRRCCGEPYGFTGGRKYKASEFLKIKNFNEVIK